MVDLWDKERPADGKAIIVVALNRRLIIGVGLVKQADVLAGAEGVRVVVIVAIKFVGAAMEPVGSRLRGDYNLAAAAASEGSVVVAAFQSEFLDGVDAGGVEQGAVGTAVI